MSLITVIMSQWGKTVLTTGMFYSPPKIYLQLSFHLSASAASKQHTALRAAADVLAETVQQARMTGSLSTIGGNQSQMISG